MDRQRAPKTSLIIRNKRLNAMTSASNGQINTIAPEVCPQRCVRSAEPKEPNSLLVTTA